MSKDKSTKFLLGNRNGHYNTELRCYKNDTVNTANKYKLHTFYDKKV